MLNFLNIFIYLDNAIYAVLLQFLSISKSIPSLRFNSLVYFCVSSGPVTKTSSFGLSLHECDRFRLLLVVGMDSLQTIVNVSSLLNECVPTSITLFFEILNGKGIFWL